MSMEAIKELRERTGAGMLDCKKALTENGNDIENHRLEAGCHWPQYAVHRG